MNSFKLKKWDIILGVLIPVSAVIIYLVFSFTLKPGNVVKVSVNGKVKYEFSINENLSRKIDTKWGENTLEIKDKKVRVTFADCPDEICVNHRAISSVGETIVCLPHKLAVKIEEK